MRRKLVNQYLGLPAGATPLRTDLAKMPRQRLVNAQHAAKGGMRFLPGTKWSGASPDDIELFAGCAQVPKSRSELAETALGFLGWRTVHGLRTGFDASVCDGDLMPEAVGEGALGCEVPLLLAFCKDEYGVLETFPGLKSSDIRSKKDAVERLARFLPVRGVLECKRAEAIAAAYLEGYLEKVMPGSPLPSVYMCAAQDLWQYHTVTTAADTHSAVLPGSTFVAQYAYDAGGGHTTHSADVAATFGVMPNIPSHQKGADFEGIVEIVQSCFAAFARTGDPSTDKSPFVPWDKTAPKMTILDSPVCGGGCKVVDAWTTRDEIFRDMVAGLRAAES
jgi:hypothetical protein